MVLWFLFFEIGFLWVALAVLELAKYTGRLLTHRDPPVSAFHVLGIKGVLHHSSAQTLVKFIQAHIGALKPVLKSAVIVIESRSVAPWI